MEREIWAWLMVAVRDVSRKQWDTSYHTHTTMLIIKVYLWSVLHDRPVVWACDRRHGDRVTKPKHLPSQSTMSRRLREDNIQHFLESLGRRLNGNVAPTMSLVKLIDGKALSVAAHSKDPDAKWGRGSGQMAKGYKLHYIDSGKPMPERFEITPLNVSEQVVARRLIDQPARDDAASQQGYLVADAGYDDDQLYQLAAKNGCRLIAPRRKPCTGLGHKTHHPDRLRAIETLEVAPLAGGSFGAGMMKLRTQIERTFGNMASFFAGLHHLPPWVRRQHRVQTYVHAKLLINAARIRIIHA
jgi:hypothetical protein